jgi:hypothetical protein
MSLTRELIRELINDKVVTAVYGGGFKPPTAGHFTVVKKALADFPEIDKFIIYVGGGVRDEIGQDESLLIWEKYKKLLPSKVEIVPSKAPIGDIIRYGKNNPDEIVYFVIGARENNEGDLQDIAARTTGVEDKYPNVKVKVISTPGGGMSGTNARRALNKTADEFYKYLPQELSVDDKAEIYNILRPSDIKEIKIPSMDELKSKFKDFVLKVKQEGKETKEAVALLIKAAKGDIELTDDQKTQIGDQLKDVLKLLGLTAIATLPGGFIAGALIKFFKAEHLVTPSAFLTENATYSNHIDLLPLLAKLTNHMVDKGYNIKPLPGLKLVDGDVENAKDFFGKTAYYDPNEQMIVLYTEGRHPKDIARSYAHEMIHHMQNLEGRLGDITTTNTQEDDHLNDIEAEANLKGTMTFRNWTDSLQENKDPFGLLEDILPEGAYDSIVSKLAKDVLNAWKSQFDEKRDRLFAAIDTDYELEDAKGRPLDFNLLAKIDFKKTKDRKYRVDGGANEGDDETEGFVALTFQVDPRELPQMWSRIAIDIRDVLRHEIEHLTQGGWNVRSDKEMEDDSQIRDLIQKYKLIAPANYFLLDKEVDAMLQGMYFKAKKSRRPMKDVIDDYLALQPVDAEEKENILSRWRSRAKALSLPIFEVKYKLKKVLKEEETEQKYTVYCDMDGVICDFDKRFEQVSGGIPPRTYEEKYGKQAFWDLIDNQTGVKFWVGIPWMPNGKQLWDYIKKYTPTLLSAPSRNNESRLGKRLWVKNNIPGTKLVLANAENKQNYANPKSILIDDRPSNIEQWRSKGGIGILFVSTEQTIKELQEYGL